MCNFEKEFLKRYKKNHPKIFEMSVFLLNKIDNFGRDLRILIYILMALVLPVYLLIFEFILTKYY